MEREHIPLTLRVERELEKWLTEKEDYTRVATPIIIGGDKLTKMNIEQDNHLREQVFWVDRKKCLRPMLAPNLYEVMRDLHRITNKPVRIFEAGSCFRKESQGAQHMNEFTMLNLVELDSVEDGSQMERLEALAKGAMEAVGIDHYELVRNPPACTLKPWTLWQTAWNWLPDLTDPILWTPTGEFSNPGWELDWGWNESPW